MTNKKIDFYFQTMTQQTEKGITEDIKKPRLFSNKSSISKHLFCGICQDVYDEPLRLNCGHTFCSSCISEWIKKAALCPNCRVKLILSELSKDLIASNIINDLEVICNNSPCPWKDQLVNLQEHLRCCVFDEKQIPEHMKNFIFGSGDSQSCKEESISKSMSEVLEETDENQNSNYVDFNSKIGLKARLYQKHKSTLERVLSKQEEEVNKEKRDSIFQFIDSFTSFTPKK
jgi:hypothetical protein